MSLKKMDLELLKGEEIRKGLSEFQNIAQEKIRGKTDELKTDDCCEKNKKFPHKNVCTL